jgi:hypothetical protein
MKRDLSKFNPHVKAPDTEAKRDLVKISRTRLEEWIEECIQDQEWPFHGDLVSVRHLKSERVCPRNCQGMSDYKWAEALKRAGAVQYEHQVKLSNNARCRIWIVHRHEMMGNLNKEEIVIQYEKWLQTEHPGGNPLEDSIGI